MIRILILILLCGTLEAQDVRKVLFVDTVTVFNEQKAIKSVLRDLNWKRVKRGMLPLSYKKENQERLSKNAVGLSKRYHHTSGIYKAETIAKTGRTTKSIMQAFMDSPPHRKALMDRLAGGVCIGIHYKPANIIQKGNTTTHSVAMFYTVIRTY